MKFLKYTIAIIVFSLTSCYSPDKNNLNEKASLHASDALSENPLLLIPMTFSSNPKLNSMSTLYGNKTAMEYAKRNKNNIYPEGTLLYEVTWEQKADSLWYGANIPNKIIKVERIQFIKDSSPKYELYIGSPLRKSNSKFSAERINAIISQPIAVSP